MRTTTMRSRLRAANGDAGSSAVEYGLMVAGVCMALVVVVAAIGRVMTAMFTAQANSIGTDQAYVAMNGTAAPTATTVPASTPTPTPTTPAPTTPTGLTATPGSTNIALNWNDVANATSYTVTGCGATFTTTTSAGTCTGLTNGTSYSISVTASGVGGTSSAATTTASPVAAPATPTGLTATPSDGQVTLNWNDVPNATTYTVTGCGATFTTSTSGATCSGLTNGTTYNVSVTANGAGGTSSPATVSVVPAVPITKGGSSKTPTVSWAEVVTIHNNYDYQSCSVSPSTTGVSCGFSSSKNTDTLTLSTLSTAPSGTVVTLTWTFTTGGKNPQTYTETRVFVIA